MSKRKLILIIVIVAAFAVFAVGAFRSALTPYVTFDEAEAKGTSVQVSGAPEKTSAKVDPSSKVFTFLLTDRAGRTVPVEYDGAPPGNFDQAESVVVVGQMREGVFVAHKILVKCPSKYQGAKEGVSR